MTDATNPVRHIDRCTTPRCDRTVYSHVLYSAAGQQDTGRVCRPCLLSILAGLATIRRQRVHHVADHPVTVTCGRPDATWVDDRCQIAGAEVTS